jgi:hypothetical protein
MREKKFIGNFIIMLVNTRRIIILFLPFFVFTMQTIFFPPPPSLPLPLNPIQTGNMDTSLWASDCTFAVRKDNILFRAEHSESSFKVLHVFFHYREFCPKFHSIPCVYVRL